MKIDLEGIRERYKDIFDYTLDFIYITDLKGNFLDANDIALTTLGYEREELPNITFKDILDNDQLKVAFNRVKEIFEDIGRQSKKDEYKLKTKDGNFVYIETYGIPLWKKGKIYAILGVGNNITERKIAEQNLKDSEERFRGLYENTPFAILLINSKGIVMDCNPTTKEMFGYNKDELIDKKLGRLEAIRPEDLPTLLNIFKQFVDGEEVHRVDLQIKKKDGSLIWTNIQASLVEISGEIFVQAILHEYKKSTIIG
ncbi:MAG: PAS domain-containing protein [Candidatus Hodarchaeota archaeon]